MKEGKKDPKFRNFQNVRKGDALESSNQKIFEIILTAQFPTISFPFILQISATLSETLCKHILVDV